MDITIFQFVFNDLSITLNYIFSNIFFPTEGQNCF